LVIDAADLGLARAAARDLRGGDASVNADVARRVFAGEPGPVRDAVLVNAAAALVAYDGGIGSDAASALRAGIDRAGAAVDAGAAADVLAHWITVADAARASS